MTLKLIAKLFFEIVVSLSKKQSCSGTLIKQLDLRRMTLNLIARLFLEKDARFSKIQYCPNNFDKIIGREMDYFKSYSKDIPKDNC